MKKHTVSFKNAFAGLEWALRTQTNLRTHAVLSMISLIGGWYFEISYAEFLTVGVLIAIGLCLELINTSLEVATDAIDTNWREDIKIAKDVAAAAVLVYSLGAAVIAGVIFVPRILAAFS